MNPDPHQLASAKLVYLPRLSQGNHTVTSDETDEYNCAAWAAGNSSDWWWPFPDVPEHFWPPGVRRDETIEAFIDGYGTLGYEVCDGGELDASWEKVAVYTNANGSPTHVARQLSSGRWTSKLGNWEDIEHQSERDVQGDWYGAVRLFMRRPRAQ